MDRMPLNSRVVEMLSRLAEDNPGVRSKYKIAAGVVYKKHLVATGINSYKTHPMMWSLVKIKTPFSFTPKLTQLKTLFG
jgi:hypothetical protein